MATMASPSFAATTDPDPDPPPVVAGIGQAGFSLITGSFSYSTTEVVVGQPDGGGLAFSRSFFGPGWRDNYAGTINSSGSVYTVSTGTNSESFTLASGSFTSDQAMGSTLTLSSGIYTYTMRDGTVVLFDAALANGGAVYDANVARITTLTRPTGEQIVWHYKSVTVQSVAALRLQSVTNNLGYQLHFDYSLNNPTLSSQLTAWKTLTKVTGINNAVDYCSPTADTCSSLTVTWPSATYGTSGGYSTVTDNVGNVTRYSAGANGLNAIRRPTSPSADSLAIFYSGGRVYQVTNASGTWTYSYVDASGQRTTTVTDPLSHTRVVVSNLAASTILSDTNGTGNQTSYQYDAYRRITRITRPEGDYTEFTYDARGNVTQTTFVAKSASGLSNIVTSASYDASCSNPRTCNQPNSTTDGRGFRTDYTYDATHSGVLTATEPAPSGSAPVGSGTRPQTRFSYTSLSAYYKNSGGSIVAAATPVYRLTSASACATSGSCSGGGDETITTFGYGSQSAGTANNLLPVSETVAAGDGSLTATTTATYDAVGNVETSDRPLSGDTTRNYYDTDRRLTGEVGPDSGSSVYRAIRNTYTADGQVSVVERGTVTSQSSNPWGSFSSLWRSENTYDSVGRLARETIVGGGSPTAVVQYSYDAAGRPDCTAARMNPATFAALPASACTLTLVAAMSPPPPPGLGPDRITRTTYDNANRPTKVTQGYGSGTPVDEWTATYTANGQIATLADAGGNLTTNEYDGFDRRSRMRYPNTSGGGSSTTDDEFYAYDANANVTQLTLRDGATLTSTYDNLNRITLTDASGGSALDVTITYDLFGRLLTQATSAQTLTFTYDQLDRNLTSQSSVLGTVSYQYDLAGRRTRMTWPDAFYVAYDVDLYDAVTAIRENGAGSGAGVLATYTYDALGRRTLLTRGNATTETPAYDAAFNLDSLAQNLTGSGQDETISLDHNALGQIITRTSSNAAYQWSPIAPGTTAYTDNGLNQYASVGGTNFSYDDERGNLTGDGSRTFGYDVFNRLTSVSGAGAMTLSYDPAGRLYETTASSTTTRFLYDGDELIAEFDTGGALLRRYVPGAAFDEHLTWYEGSGTSDRRYLAQDERGSVIAVDASGGVTPYSYDEYGNPNAWGSPATAPRFRYAGAMMLAEAQLYHMRGRVYAPGVGRFLQTDPILFAGGMNLYAYVGNDPMNWIDPLGLMTVEDECTRNPASCDTPVEVRARRRDPWDWSEWCASGSGRGRCFEGAATDRDVFDLWWEHGGLRTAAEIGPITGELLAIADCLNNPEACTLTDLALSLALRRFGIRCGCFVEGTMVATPAGLRPIEDIAIGDQVLAWNPETRQTTTQAVTALIRPEPKLIWRLETRDAGGETEVFEVTDDHPWYVEGAGWVETQALRPGQRIETADDRGLTILDIARTDRVERSYNLTIDGPHTFLVGEGGAVVHNAPCLKLLHTVRTYLTSRLAAQNFRYWRTRSTDEIVQSLRPGQLEALRVRADGLILNGNTRVLILRSRGYDINSLPRETLP